MAQILAGGHKVTSLFGTDFGGDILLLIEIIIGNLKMVHKTQFIITIYLARKVCNLRGSKSNKMVSYLCKNVITGWARHLLSICMFFLVVLTDIYLCFAPQLTILHAFSQHKTYKINTK